MLISNGPHDTFLSPCLFIMQGTHGVKCVGNKLLMVYHPTSYMVYLSMLIPLPSPAWVNCRSNCCRAGQNPVTNPSTSAAWCSFFLSRQKPRLKTSRPVSSQNKPSTGTTAVNTQDLSKGVAAPQPCISHSPSNPGSQKRCSGYLLEDVPNQGGGTVSAEKHGRAVNVDRAK